MDTNETNVITIERWSETKLFQPTQTVPPINEIVNITIPEDIKDLEDHELVNRLLSGEPAGNWGNLQAVKLNFQKKKHEEIGEQIRQGEIIDDSVNYSYRYSIDTVEDQETHQLLIELNNRILSDETGQLIDLVLGNPFILSNLHRHTFQWQSAWESGKLLPLEYLLAYLPAGSAVYSRVNELLFADPEIEKSASLETLELLWRRFPEIPEDGGIQNMIDYIFRKTQLNPNSLGFMKYLIERRLDDLDGTFELDLKHFPATLLLKHDSEAWEQAATNFLKVAIEASADKETTAKQILNSLKTVLSPKNRYKTLSLKHFVQMYRVARTNLTDVKSWADFYNEFETNNYDNSNVGLLIRKNMVSWTDDNALAAVLFDEEKETLMELVKDNSQIPADMVALLSLILKKSHRFSDIQVLHDLVPKIRMQVVKDNLHLQTWLFRNGYHTHDGVDLSLDWFTTVFLEKNRVGVIESVKRKEFKDSNDIQEMIVNIDLLYQIYPELAFGSSEIEVVLESIQEHVLLSQLMGLIRYKGFKESTRFVQILKERLSMLYKAIVNLNFDTNKNIALVIVRSYLFLGQEINQVVDDPHALIRVLIADGNLVKDSQEYKRYLAVFNIKDA